MKSSDESDISDLQHTGREGRCSYMCERYARKPDMHTKTVAQKRGKEVEQVDLNKRIHDYHISHEEIRHLDITDTAISKSWIWRECVR